MFAWAGKRKRHRAQEWNGKRGEYLQPECCSWCAAEVCSAVKAHQAVVCSVRIRNWSLLGNISGMPDTTPNSLSSQLPISKCPVVQRCLFAGDYQSGSDPVSVDFSGCQASCWYHPRCWWPILHSDKEAGISKDKCFSSHVSSDLWVSRLIHRTVIGFEDAFGKARKAWIRFCIHPLQYCWKRKHMGAADSGITVCVRM